MDLELSMKKIRIIFLANIILSKVCKKEGHMTKNTLWYRPYQYVLLNWYGSSKRGMGQVWSQ